MRKIIILLLLFTLLQHSSSAQNRAIDSLLKVINSSSLLADTTKVNVLAILCSEYENIGSFEKALKYGNQGLEISQKIDYKNGLAICFNNLGNVFSDQSKYAKALEFYFKSLKIDEAANDKKGISKDYNNIGIIYQDRADYGQAFYYFWKGLKIDEVSGDKVGLANDYTNIGINYLHKPDYSLSLDYFNKSLKIHKELNDKKSIANDYNNIGDLYAKYFIKDSIEFGLKTNNNQRIGHTALLDSALVLQKNALTIYKKFGDKYGSIPCLKGIADVYLYQQKYKDAISFYQQSLKLADSLGAANEKKDAAKGISDSYRKARDWEKALIWYEKYINYKDSIFSSAKNRDVADKELENKYEKKAVADSAKAVAEKLVIREDLGFERTKSYGLYGGLALLVIFGGIMFNRFKVTQKQKEIIVKEKQRSDELLLNILPEDVAEELKETGLAKAKHFGEVSVLFTDFKGFTLISEKMKPEELVFELHHCFSAFDKISQKFGLEKIKTIGDAYMCVSGLPRVSEESAVDAVKAGIAIRNFMKRYNEDKIAQGKEPFEIRIGIHSGPVVAGIVGVKKFAYDIWGDTVNTAARVESSGEIGKVNISGATYELVKNYFSCTFRGKIQAKNKGEIEMYFVESKSGKIIG